MAPPALVFRGQNSCSVSFFQEFELEGEGGGADGRFVTVGARDWETGTASCAALARAVDAQVFVLGRFKSEYAGGGMLAAAAAGRRHDDVSGAAYRRAQCCFQPRSKVAVFVSERDVLPSVGDGPHLSPQHRCSTVFLFCFVFGGHLTAQCSVSPSSAGHPCQVTSPATSSKAK
jgi:hypothetical protein